MTPADIYAMPIARAGSLIDMLNYGEMWPGFPECYSWAERQVPVPGLGVRVHAELRRDDRRFWRVVSVWYWTAPVACGRMAGREGDDAWDVWITDVDKYHRLAGAVRAAVAPQLEGGLEATALDADLGNVLEWYGERTVAGIDAYLPWSL